MALCEIHAEERRLLYVAWQLWWAGYDVPLKLVREFLGRVAAQWDRPMQEAMDIETGGLSESGYKMVDEASTERYESKVLRQARRRVGSAQFGTLMGVMLSVASGKFDRYSSNPTGSPEEDERRLIEKGLGLDRRGAGRRGAGWKTNTGSRLSDGLEKTLKEGSRLYGERPFSEVLTATTDEDLMGTRDWARSMVIGMELIGVLAHQAPESEASGFLVMGEVLREAGPPEEALLLLSLLTWRLWGPGSMREKLDSYHEGVEQVLLQLRELEGNSFLYLYPKDSRASGPLEPSDGKG